jgi:predicted metalloprotease
MLPEASVKRALPGQGSAVTQNQGNSGASDQDKVFVSKVLKETEVVWSKVLPEQTGKQYVDPKLVLFNDQVQSACGTADSAVGPFYCPGDSQVYIDLGFYETMKNQLHADGDFARAYVVAHEVGHHVQNLLGTSHKVDQMRARMSGKDFNKVSVRLELQADFFAGVWAHYAKELHIDEKDVRDVMNAASQIGDDTLQKHAQGYVVPDSFTHGTSAQRVKWFMAGFKSGRIRDGDTFNSTNL